MHYKNKVEAKEGDPVIFIKSNGKVASGTIHSLQASCESCNAQVAVPIPGGVMQEYVNVSSCYHALDAYGAMEEKQPAEQVP